MKYLKNTFRALMALFISVLFWSFTPPAHNIIGEWAGTDKTGKSAVFIFDKTLNVVMIMNGEKMDGHEHERDGHKVEIRYELNETQKPMWLDFTFYKDGVKNEKNTAKGIFRYLSDNKIELRMNFDSDTRYEKFDTEDKESTVILTRKGK
jgi:hypothetical protein